MGGPTAVLPVSNLGCGRIYGRTANRPIHAANPGRRTMRRFRKERTNAVLYLFIFPSLLTVLIFSYFPVANAIFHSFFIWNGNDYREYIGLGNFLRLFSDETFRKSFVTVGILLLANLLKMWPSIFLAVFIHRVQHDGWRYFYRSLVVLPMLVPHVVVLFVWKFIYDPNYGPLNAILDWTGIKSVLSFLSDLFNWNVFFPDLPIAWLTTPELILPALIFWGFPWVGNVIGILVYLSGLEAIDKSIYESAEIDGAGPFRVFYFIELPLILTQIRIMLILMVINTFKNYGFFYLALDQNGGPAGAGMVPSLWMFNRAFYAGQFGYACAIGMALFGLILFLTWINNKYLRVDK